MNDFLLRLKKIAVQYREWLVIILLLALVGYILSMYQRLTPEDIEREVLGRKDVRPEAAEILEYDRIVDGIITVPPPYIDLVKYNPFIPLETILESQRVIQQIFDEGRRLFDAGSFLEAKEKFQEVLSLDPFEARIDYRPYKPTLYVRRCEEEAEKQDIRGIYSRATDVFSRAQSMDRPGGASEEELLRIYEESQRLFQTVVQRGEVALPEAVADAREKLETTNQRVEQLQIITFNATLNRLYQEAVELWNRREESLANVANARDNLSRAQEMIANFPGQLQDQALQIRDRTGQLLNEIEQEVERRYPGSLQQAQNLVSTGQGNLEQLTQAQDIYKVLFQLRGEEDIQTQIDELEQVLVGLRRDQTIARAQQFLQQARQSLETAKGVLEAGEDWDRLETSKREGLAILDQLDGLPRLSDLDTLRTQAASLRSELNALEVPPLIEGIVIQAASDRTARGIEPSTNRRIFLNIGRNDPVSGLTYVRPGATGQGGQIQSIIVQKQGFRETELPVTQ